GDRTASTDLASSFVSTGPKGSYKCTTKDDEQSNVEKLSASQPFDVTKVPLWRLATVYPPTVTSRQTSTLQPYKVGVIILSLIVLVQTGLLVGALVKIVILTKKGSKQKTREERLEMDVNVAYCTPKEIMSLRTSKKQIS
ncbi:hypothetical protein GBAR_LOCUS1523, partial [Geodia barretti]